MKEDGTDRRTWRRDEFSKRLALLLLLYRKEHTTQELLTDTGSGGLNEGQGEGEEMKCTTPLDGMQSACI